MTSTILSFAGGLALAVVSFLVGARYARKRVEEFLRTTLDYHHAMSERERSAANVDSMTPPQHAACAVSTNALLKLLEKGDL